MSEGKHDGPPSDQHGPTRGDATSPAAETPPAGPASDATDAGPADRLGALLGASGARGTGPGGELGGELDSADEDALRRLLRDAAGEPEPRADALDHIRRTIPVRRARRRNALIGVGAAVLAVGVTLPLMRAGVVPGPLNAHTSANAAQSADAAASGAGAAVDGAAGGERHTGPDGSRGDAKEKADDPVPHEDAPDNEELAPTAPSCTRDQLGQPVVSVAEPNNNGRIYGHFRLTNVSDETCRIKGGGELTAVSQGRATGYTVQVLDHTSGGRASQLPDPADSSGRVVLASGASYEVRFAWVPPDGIAGCTPSTPGPDPSEPGGGGSTPTPGTDGGGGDGGEDPTTGGGETPTTGGGGSDGDGGDQDGGDGSGGGSTGGSGGGTGGGTGGGKMPDQQEEADGLDTFGTGGGGAAGDTAVVLRYTPASGEPRLPAAYLTGACGGTVYRTQPLPTS
ncbi:hypothetical protein H3146_17900 [Streptomyces sp. OF3]|uniref:DUF4232 domain-containing protein n=1 Tax=Streptomyces alkaliterrae TaxID=2213162 RepID=A0A7W3WMP3_9ACTN|nr:hypothetical protein [Streptomyces alkaliterrae]MBB1255212.1 hypothetical protein [Streptomyces alkaliterrae]